MTTDTEAPDLFAGEGDIFDILRHKDWSASPLGPVSGWPPELRGAARICLHSGFQMAVLWGERFTYLYNEAASALFGDKHPWALGQPVETVWPEAWPVVDPARPVHRASRGDRPDPADRRMGAAPRLPATPRLGTSRAAGGAGLGELVGTPVFGAYPGHGAANPAEA